jgi:hypothetical protein
MLSSVCLGFDDEIVDGKPDGAAPVGFFTDTLKPPQMAFIFEVIERHRAQYPSSSLRLGRARPMRISSLMRPGANDFVFDAAAQTGFDGSLFEGVQNRRQRQKRQVDDVLDDVLMVVVPAQVADHLRGDSFQVFGTNLARCLTHQTVA